MTEDTRQGDSEAQRRSQRVGLIDRVTTEAGIHESQAALAIAMSYEHIANGVDALNSEPAIHDLVTVLRVFAAKLRASTIRRDLPVVAVLDAFEDWA